jgi:hypothetical protein
VKLVPEFNYAAPKGTPAPALSSGLGYNLADVALAAYRESPQLNPVFAPGNPESRAAFRIRLTF